MRYSSGLLCNLGIRSSTLRIADWFRGCNCELGIDVLLDSLRMAAAMDHLFWICAQCHHCAVDIVHCCCDLDFGRSLSLVFDLLVDNFAMLGRCPADSGTSCCVAFQPRVLIPG